MSESQAFVTFDRPPVAEVVCGVTFDAPASFTSAHLGLFWSRLEGFDHAEEAAPLLPIVEGQEIQNIVFGQTPIRVWYRSENESEVVQLQKDRFLCNWRRTERGHAYPRYNQIIERFEEQLKKFEEFVMISCKGPITPKQYELTYINHILAGEGWSSLAELDQIFRDLSWRPANHAFLPAPDTVDFAASFALPGSKGRLHVRLQTAMLKHDSTPLLVLELTARGFHGDRRAWFDVGHEWIVKGFEDLTQHSIQRNVWKKKDHAV